MARSASSCIRRLLTALPSFLVTAAVGVALLHVNVSAVTFEVKHEYWRHFDRHCGWPATYSATFEQIHREGGHWTEVGWKPPRSHSIKREVFVGSALALDLLWASVTLVATWTVSRRAVAAARRRQFSVLAGLVAMTVAAFCVFMFVHYPQTSHEWPDYEFGRPYLPMSGLYRWFGPRSLYDWLSHFTPWTRGPVLAGWSCMVCFACSSIPPLVRAYRRSPRG
jgi:hypothetical protein